jgi:hypothetical protein
VKATVSLVFALLAGTALAATPTPTPRPRLSGGFGRAEATPPPPRGQSLADVVRAASETRKTRETPRAGSGVSITNRSLVTDPNRGKLTSSRPAPRPAAPTGSAGTSAKETPAASAASAASAAVKSDSSAPISPPADATSQEEERWRTIAQTARRRVTEGRDNVARLDSETHKLENDFYAWDDGQYRDNVIKPAWDKKREELETARRELAEAERDLEDLPEKARKAGALPGWIRE